jgi:hypothetical protein
MNNKNTGGPAFPMAAKEAVMYASCLEDLPNLNLDKAERAHLEAKVVALCGMTLRDYFAAKAMQGLMGRVWGELPPEELFKTWATSAYAVADAMLKAREQ